MKRDNGDSDSVAVVIRDVSLNIRWRNEEFIRRLYVI